MRRRTRGRAGRSASGSNRRTGRSISTSRAFTIGDGRPVTVTFADEGGKTRLTLLLTLETTHPEEQQREGWTAMLVNLGEHLAAG
jgi:hypothetical protein